MFKDNHIAEKINIDGFKMAAKLLIVMFCVKKSFGIKLLKKNSRGALESNLFVLIVGDLNTLTLLNESLKTIIPLRFFEADVFCFPSHAQNAYLF